MLIAAGLGGAATWGTSSYLAGNNPQQIATDAVFGAIAGMAGAAAGQAVGIAAPGLLSSFGVSCAAGTTGVAARLPEALSVRPRVRPSARRRACPCRPEHGQRHGRRDGRLERRRVGAVIGGPLGAIFHQVCFVAGTQVVERVIEQPHEARRSLPMTRCMSAEEVGRTSRTFAAGTRYW